MRTKTPPNLFLLSPKLNHLNILKGVAANARVTQAELAQNCSLSVAMVNNYMKDLCQNNFLRYNRKSKKSVTYYLTLSGTEYLETLQHELIIEMARMFAHAKERVRDSILEQAKSPLRHVVLYGTGHLAQIVFHALDYSDIRVLGICKDTPGAVGTNFCGHEIVASSKIRELSPDAVVIADSPKRMESIRTLGSLVHYGIELIQLDQGLVANPAELSIAASKRSSYETLKSQSGAAS